jgi:hypothetical protein
MSADFVLNMSKYLIRLPNTRAKDRQWVEPIGGRWPIGRDACGSRRGQRSTSLSDACSVIELSHAWCNPGRSQERSSFLSMTKTHTGQPRQPGHLYRDVRHVPPWRSEWPTDSPDTPRRGVRVVRPRVWLLILVAARHGSFPHAFCAKPSWTLASQTRVTVPTSRTPIRLLLWALSIARRKAFCRVARLVLSSPSAG